jgi:hypothetical protein
VFQFLGLKRDAQQCGGPCSKRADKLIGVAVQPSFMGSSVSEGSGWRGHVLWERPVFSPDASPHSEMRAPNLVSKKTNLRTPRGAKRRQQWVKQQL